MMSSHTPAQLPVPLAPELLLAVRPDQPAMIVDIAPRLAAWTGHTVAELVGQPVAEVFHDLIPGLPLAVEEMVRSGQMIHDYRLALTDHQGAHKTLLLQAARRPGVAPHKYHLVACRLEEVAHETPDAAEYQAAVGFHGLLGRSPAFARVLRKIEIYGPTDAPVLITGETGTGKELVAHALHDCSKRQNKPFVAVNCAALSEELLESELFGHEKGAFTSAVRAHRGRFERAHGGTLFLDEIGDMPLRVQVKLLRVLEEGVIERVGGEREISVDVRLEAATNVPLELAVQARTFRADLYHRLAVLRIHLPPLRQRPEDLPLLTAHFLQHLNDKYHRQVRRLSPEAQALLASYSWPGNIRELRNVLERVYIETLGEVIGRKAFDEWVEEREQFSPGAWNMAARQTALAERPVLITPYSGPYRVLPAQGDAARLDQQTIDVAPSAFTYLDPQTAATRPSQESTAGSGALPLTEYNIAQAYRRAAGNVTQAARLLGVHRATLYRHMQSLGITRDDLAASREASRPFSSSVDA